MPDVPMLSRRHLSSLLPASAAAAVLPSSPGFAQAGPLLMRPVPSAGEPVPAVGLGSWVTFNVGDDIAARDACAE